MKDFILKMMQLGLDLEKSQDPMQSLIIINDAEILYKEEFENSRT